MTLREEIENTIDLYTDDSLYRITNWAGLVDKIEELVLFNIATKGKQYNAKEK